MTTVAATTPYAWPYDGRFDPARAALLLVGSVEAPGAVAQAVGVAGALRAAGGVVLHVTTTPPPGRGRPVTTPPPAIEDQVADHHLHAAGIDGFYGSPLDGLLRAQRRDQLLLTGAWLETAVHSTLRSANDRGYECLVVSDCVGSYFPDFQRIGLEMIKAQGGIFGWVADSSAVIPALRGLATTAA